MRIDWHLMSPESLSSGAHRLTIVISRGEDWWCLGYPKIDSKQKIPKGINYSIYSPFQVWRWWELLEEESVRKCAVFGEAGGKRRQQTQISTIVACVIDCKLIRPSRCRESVGGRRCDRCLAGFYGFPHCYGCRCNVAGTTEEICDASTAQCTCKVG